MVGSIDLVSSIDTLSLVLVVSVCMAGAVDVGLYVRLNRLVWSTQAGDAVKSERWGAAQNSTFELEADEAVLRLATHRECVLWSGAALLLH